jgi:carbon monoxide dehydrogenase subunit G
VLSGEFILIVEPARAANGPPVPSYERTIDINATPERVWAVMTDIERWPEWTTSVRSARRIDDGPLAVGSRADMDLEGAPPSTWTVTTLEAGRSFAWTTSARGVPSVATHTVEPHDGGSRVRLGIEAASLLATLFSPWISRVFRRNVDREAEGLKAYCEARARPAEAPPASV